MRKVIGLIVVMALLLGWGAPAQAAEYPQLERALAWLLTNQQQDGGFTSGFSAGSDLGATTEVVLAFAAAGERFEDPSPLAYLEAQVQAGAVTDAASLSRAVMLARALGADPRAIGGKDLVKALLATQDKTTGRFGESLYAHAYALLALHNAGEPLPETAVTLLLEEQQDNGSWAMLGGEGRRIPTPRRWRRRRLLPRMRRRRHRRPSAILRWPRTMTVVSPGRSPRRMAPTPTPIRRR